MACTFPKPVVSFESWLCRRVAQAVEAGEVSVDLLTELQAVEAARGREEWITLPCGPGHLGLAEFGLTLEGNKGAERDD